MTPLPEVVPTIAVVNDRDAENVVRALELALGALAELPGGALFAALINEWSRIQRMKAQVLLGQIIEILGDQEETIVRRLTEDARLVRLLGDAARAAADSDTSAKIRTLSDV